MKLINARNPLITTILTALLTVGLALGFGLAQETQETETQEATGDVNLRLASTVTTLVADGESQATVLAFLSDGDGNPLDDERVRFTVRSGDGEFAENGTSDSMDVAVDGTSEGNGVYSAQFQAGNVAGTVTVAATWLSAPTADLPSSTLDIELTDAAELTLEIDDDVVLNDEDEATVVAYVLDSRGLPVANANLTFRIVEGTGSIVEGQSNDGRYSAVYTPSSATGTTTIEVSLPTITEPLTQQVSVEVVETTSLSATIFPDTVERLPEDADLSIENTATIFVPVRDGEGDLVRGLSRDDLVAQVISGPGEVSQGVEMFAGNERSGVYKFTFTASNTTGNSTVLVTNLRAPEGDSLRSVEVDIETVTEVGTGVVSELALETFSDDPLFADGSDNALLMLMARDSDGRPITDLSPTIEVIQGQGEVGDVVEVRNIGGAEGTGIYVAGFTIGEAAESTTSTIRATVGEANAPVVTTDADVTGEPFGAPRVVVFPDNVPASRTSSASVDIFDFEAEDIGQDADSRYRVEIQSGPGSVSQEANNDGSLPDLVDGDHLSTARVRVSTDSAADQTVSFAVIDEVVSGFPTAQGELQLGGGTTLTAMTNPASVQRGDHVQIIVFARDEFDLSVPNHDLVLTLESGSGEVLASGRMIDDGGEIEGFSDPVANDGMYVGVFRASNIVEGPVTLRITDTTPPTQPTATVDLSVE